MKTQCRNLSRWIRQKGLFLGDVCSAEAEGPSGYLNEWDCPCLAPSQLVPCLQKGALSATPSVPCWPWSPSEHCRQPTPSCLGMCRVANESLVASPK